MRTHKEDNLQIQVATYLRIQYPKVFWFHPANERKTKVYAKKNGKFWTPEGALLKKKGVRAGIPDILIFEEREIIGEAFRSRCCGLAVELKVKPNTATDLQLECLLALEKQGWKTDICYTFEQAQKTIDSYLK